MRILIKVRGEVKQAKYSFQSIVLYGSKGMSDIIKYHTNKQICKPSVQDVVMYDPKRVYG